MYFKETPGGEKVGTIIPQADTRNIDQPDSDVRKAMSGRETNILELEKMAETYKKLGEIDIPGEDFIDKDGIQVKEMDERIAKEELIKQLKKDLNIDINSNTPPGYEEYMKEMLGKKADLILNGEVDYEKVVEEMKGRDDGGRTPGEKRDPRKES